jgi:hypothetical protein
MDTKDKIVLTRHAKARLEEMGLSIDKALWMLHTAIKEKPSHPDTKQQRYGRSQAGVSYWSHGTTLFTVRHTPDNRTGEPIVLVITVSDKMLNIGRRGKQGV